MATPRAPLNLSWVTPQLAVGGSYPIEAAEHLARALGITHVVDVRGEACDDVRALREVGIELLHLPTADTRAIALERLDQGVRWVSAQLDRGRRVYIHCEYGIGRSALLTLCVLAARGEAPLDALRRAKAARRVLSPSPEQLEALRAFVATRTDAEVPGFDDLAAIAYSHLRAGAGVGALGTGTA